MKGNYKEGARNGEWIEYVISNSRSGFHFFLLFLVLRAIVDIKERKTSLWSYTYYAEKNLHIIRINHTLNPYAFLITLLQEMAHFYTFVTYRDRIAFHGGMGTEFSEVVKSFLDKAVFSCCDITTGMEN